MRKIFNFQFSIFNSEGFTLIELMVVLSVTAVLGTLGIAGFTTYNQIQVLQSSANDLVTTLNVAKSRALSQVKLGSSCIAPSQILEGYNVNISIPNNYTLSSRCSGVTSNLDTKTLPQNVSFKSPDTSPTSFFFPVLSGGVQTPGQIVITGFGRYQTIIVNSLGGVNVQAGNILPIPTPTPTSTPTPTPTVAPTRPVAKTCSGGWILRAALNTGCAAYCGTFTPSMTCSLANFGSGSTYNNYNWNTCSVFGTLRSYTNVLVCSNQTCTCL